MIIRLQYQYWSFFHLVMALFFAVVSLPALSALSNSPVTRTTIIPYLDNNYRYKVVGHGGEAGFERPGYNDSTFTTGDAGFGNRGSCGLQGSVKTSWPLNTDMLLLKPFTLQGEVRNLKVHIAIDNDVVVYLNGEAIGSAVHDGCPSRNSSIFDVPDELLKPGGNLLAVRAIDRGGESYVDVQVTAEIVSGILPSSGGNAGQVTATIYHPNIQEGATVELSAPGVTSIFGKFPTVAISKNTKLFTTFDLRGAAVGPRTVTIHQPDGSNLTVPVAFTVLEGGTSKLTINILGPDRLRLGRSTSFDVVVRNEGLVDANFVTVFADISPDLPGRLNVAAALGQPLIGSALIPSGGSVTGSLPFDPITGGCYKAGATANEETAPDDCKQWRDLVKTLEQNLNDRQSQLNDRLAQLAIKQAQYQALGCPGNPNRADCLLLEIQIQQLEAEIANLEIAIQNILIALQWARVQLDICEAINGGKSSSIAPMSNSATVVTTTATSSSASASQIICTVASSDPNEKVGPAGFGDAKYVRDTDPLPYTIYFENLSTATAPAAEVVIIDQFDSNLDWSTFSMRAIQFGNTKVQIPSGTQNYTTFVDLNPQKNLLVKVDVKFVVGLLTVRLTAIDPTTGKPPTDPLSGFLPPNITPPEGEGSISYIVNPNKETATGTQIPNKATIVFDLNPPIETAQWLNAIDATKPNSEVMALPVSERTSSFRVKWAGNDENAGILDYTIYVSEDGNTFLPFISNTTDTAAQFLGQPGRTYYFYSIARDGAGNVEDAPLTYDASTRIAISGDLNGDGVVDCLDLKIIKASFGKKSGKAGFDQRADVNNDGIVDVRDLSFVSRQLPAGTKCS